MLSRVLRAKLGAVGISIQPYALFNPLNHALDKCMCSNAPTSKPSSVLSVSRQGMWSKFDRGKYSR